ncbi:unnamed protein product [Dibothriocephalus latus]|uniref:Uncharacterized protein n=1 Tax=Dibothriocephalus latus TaxID=60516 RepID=A0A3P7P9X0_DIBLA|nr:unnamed protein product [Dibothriocephalus latus]
MSANEHVILKSDEFIAPAMELNPQSLMGALPLSTCGTSVWSPFKGRANMTSGPDSPTKRPVLLVTLLRDIFTADNPNLSVFEHDIIVSTAGSWENFLANVPGADKSLCGLVISGSEAFIKNDPLDRFINKTAMRSDRGRVSFQYMQLPFC